MTYSYRRWSFEELNSQIVYINKELQIATHQTRIALLEYHLDAIFRVLQQRVTS